MESFKRLITPANKPQGFGFATFQDADGALRAMQLVNGVELPALEDGCVNKKLLVRGLIMTVYSFPAYVKTLGQSRREDESLLRRVSSTKDENRCMYIGPLN